MVEGEFPLIFVVLGMNKETHWQPSCEQEGKQLWGEVYTTLEKTEENLGP